MHQKLSQKEVKRIKTRTDVELQVLIECCKQQLDTGSFIKGEIADLQFFNPSAFLSLAAHHRLFPVVYQCANQTQNALILTIYNEVKIHAERNIQRMMKLSSVLLQINKLLKQAKIDFISYKGPLMINQIYGDLSKRQTRDLDILIKESDLNKATQLLTGAGYKLLDVYFAKNISHRNLFILRENHLRFSHPDHHVILELHWSLSKYFVSFKTERIFEQSVSAVFMGKEIKTMPLPLLFVFLCVHGIYHQYQSLFWLYDIAWILKNQDLDFNAVLIESEQLKCRQAVVSSVYLAHYFFNIHVSASCPAMNRKERFLFRQCNKKLENRPSKGSESRQSGVLNVLNQRIQWLKYQMLMTSDMQSRKRILFLKMIKPYVWNETENIPSNKLVYLLMTQVKWLSLLLKGKMKKSGKVKK